MAENDEEPTLPSMRLPSEEEESLPPFSLSKRKRSTASHLFSDSSDVPVFSSDDDPAVENYAEGRRTKRRFAGPWFGQGQQTVPGPSQSGSSKRTLQRQIDSGVFMGSDTSIDEILDHLPAPSASRLPELVQPPTQRPLPLQTAQSSNPEAAVRSRIQHCIDKGEEIIDLSDMQLENISNDTISLLSEFVAIPDVERDVPFEPRDPSLKLFLFQNRLTRVPGAIFDLKYLTVLSLRGNQLTELPPSIRGLVNLRELNLSQNALKYLPMDLLELLYDERCSLKTLYLHPNPWFQPKPAESGPHSGLLWLKPIPPRLDPDTSGNRWLTRSYHDMALNDKHLYAFFRARTPVEVVHSARTGPTNFRISREETYLPTEDWESEPEWPANLNRPLSKRVPSLMELSLHACLRSPYAAKLSGFLDPKSHRRLFKPLEQAQEWLQTGGIMCTVCQKLIIKPTAQWIEWWQIYESQGTVAFLHDADNIQTRNFYSHAVPSSLSGNPDEKLIPFIRSACSWQCVLHPVKGLGLVQTLKANGTNEESFNEEGAETTNDRVAHSG